MNELVAQGSLSYMLDVLGGLAPLNIRKEVQSLQEFMQNMDDSLPATTAPVKHIFAEGTYAREITMPGGLLIIGKIHKHGHINVVSKGKCKVLTEAGAWVIEAPCTFASEAGTKRVVLTFEETVWTTVHVTNETDIPTLERDLIVQDFSELELQAEFRRVE